MTLNWKNENGNPAYPSHRTIKEWCSILGVRWQPYRGWFHVPDTNHWVWFPKTASAKWQNEYRSELGEIVERYVGEGAERNNRPLLDAENHAKVNREIANMENGTEESRLVFFKDNTPSLGIPALENVYGFVGVFRIDPDRSRREGKCVYRRIADSVELPLNG